MKDKNSYQTGFTLMELLVVMLIIGILTSIAIPQYQKAVERSRASQALTVLKSFNQAATAYYLATHTYPTSFDVLALDSSWRPAEPNERWSTVAGAGEARSNGEWCLQLYSHPSGRSVYMGRLKGKYRGAGFVMSHTSTSASAGKPFCAERHSQGIIFQGAKGDYCKKVMDGTDDTGPAHPNVSTFYIFSLP